jgi:hypothetical protein
MEATWATAIPAISVCLFGPGKVWTNEPAALTGTVVGGCWAGSGSMYRAVSGIMVPAGDRLRLLHLLWIAVVAVFVDLLCLLGAKISRCGVSGCSGGGFGVSADPVSVVVFIVGAGLVTAALLIFMPWHHSRRVRVVVGFLGALASWASVSLLYGT